jgi:hypothetical protein
MSEPSLPGPGSDFAFPTETDIYILPDGRVIIADLPGELLDLVGTLGPVEPCDAAPSEEDLLGHDHPALSHDRTL